MVSAFAARRPLRSATLAATAAAVMTPVGAEFVEEAAATEALFEAATALGLGLYPAALYNSGNAFLNRSRKSVDLLS